MNQVLDSLDTLPEPLFLIERSGVICWNNKALDALLGVQLTGKEIFNFWCLPSEIAWTYREFASEFSKPGGSQIPVKVVTYPSGEYLLVRVVASIDSLNDKRFTHQQRLETLGMLAGGVAHDFNNVLTGILGHLTYLKTILPNQGKHIESLIALEDGVSKASQLSKQIVRFSKLEAAEDAHVIDLIQVVTSTCTLIKGAVPPECDLTWNIPKEELFVLGGEARLAQVLINLVINARDAIEGKGEIVVILKKCSDTTKLKRALASIELPSGSYAELCVKDSGHGMSEQTKAKIFEPYFSTKAERGTGLGLTTVKSIVSECGGAIEVKSAPKAGTEFSVFLPLYQTLERAESEAPDELLFQGKGEKILIVDDENTVRNVLRLSLEHLGYKVTTAVTGLEALKIFSEAKFAFDLVILDMIMPGLSGEEVFTRLRELHPKLKVLLVSGFSSERALRETLERGALGFHLF